MNVKLTTCVRVFVALFSLNSSYMQADTFDYVTVSLDKPFYFFDSSSKKDRNMGIVVTNESKNVSGVSISLYGSSIVDEKVMFNLEENNLDIDLYPKAFILPPARKLSIKAIPYIDNSQSESIYRIRALPKSPKSLIKENPKLAQTLASSKDDLLDDDSSIGEVMVGIGNGSIIIVQPFNSVDVKSINLVTNNENELKIINDGDYSIQVKNMVINKNVRAKEFVVLGKKSKIKKVDVGVNPISTISFEDQLGNNYLYKCNEKGCTNENKKHG
ncbi:hypothetical protein QF117_11345 [Vibrio sp. YMD68]|uniref:hypothetical protein n=1 Tax=Vibrio sp. YMD68 TaxID=3042300 RepID=UPI00249CE61F|nr:hypothetical protein [Vibrio sp. YMD68]WGW01375.1 hypothetical protein QF117_11345 [Vibrio sp. YMD68]